MKLLEVTGKTYFGDIGLRNYIIGGERDYVISATPLIRASDYEGITHLSLRKFLVDGFGER